MLSLNDATNRWHYFRDGICREYEVGIDQSFDETHVVFDIDSGRVLGFSGSKTVTYTELSSGSDNFTVCKQITGVPSCQIADTMIVSKTHL